MNLPLVLLNRRRRGGLDAYREGGFNPALVFDFDDEYYRTGGSSSTFSSAITHSRTSNATMVDSDGLLKWAPHNLLTWSEDFSNAVWGKTRTTATADFIAMDATNANSHFVSQVLPTQVLGAAYIFEVELKAAEVTLAYIFTRNEAGSTTQTWFNLSTGIIGTDTSSGATMLPLGGGWYRCRAPFTVPTADTTASLVSISLAETDNVATIATAVEGAGFFARNARYYRSDLGGMVDNPDRGDSYVPTTSSARYLARRGHHIYNGTAWVNEGLLHESEARTNLLLNSGTLATQNVTVTAVPHTLHFTGTGTVTLSGVSTDGPLVGTGTGENNRVSLTFTPTAGTLTLTVSGTVTNAQLEAGSTPSSYIPTSGASVIRAADLLTVPSANLPWSSDAVSIQMQGRMTYADDGSELYFYNWELDANNNISARNRTASTRTGEPTFVQEQAGVVDLVSASTTYYSPGVNVPFNIASRHGSTFINGAVDGVALTADTTPVALPDLSATDLNLGHDYMGCIKLLRIWSADLGDSGIAEAST